MLKSKKPGRRTILNWTNGQITLSGYRPPCVLPLEKPNTRDLVKTAAYLWHCGTWLASGKSHRMSDSGTGLCRFNVSCVTLSSFVCDCQHFGCMFINMRKDCSLNTQVTWYRPAEVARSAVRRTTLAVLGLLQCCGADVGHQSGSLKADARDRRMNCRRTFDPQNYNQMITSPRVICYCRMVTPTRHWGRTIKDYSTVKWHHNWKKKTENVDGAFW